MKDKNICGAKTKKGTPCKKAPVEGRERCHLHGGKQPRGIDSPNYKHGLYSKYAGSQLKKVLDEMENISTEDLVNADNEIKLMQALILRCRALKDDTGDLMELDTISKIIDRLVKAKQRSQSIMLEQERLVPIEDIEMLISFIEDLLINQIGEDQVYPIMSQIQTFKISDHATR